MGFLHAPTGRSDSQPALGGAETAQPDDRIAHNKGGMACGWVPLITTPVFGSIRLGTLIDPLCGTALKQRQEKLV